MNRIQIHDGSHGFVLDIQQIYMGDPKRLIMGLQELFSWLTKGYGSLACVNQLKMKSVWVVSIITQEHIFTFKNRPSLHGYLPV